MADDAVPVLRWTRVRLVEEWNIMGAGAATGALGSAAGYPEFAMLSLDGNVILRGTTWQESSGALVVPDSGSMDLQGGPEFFSLLAGNIEGFAAAADQDDHLHVDYFPDHDCLAEGSGSVVVALDGDVIPTS